MSDVEWAFLAPYLTLMREDAPQFMDADRYPRSLPCGGDQWRGNQTR